MGLVLLIFVLACLAGCIYAQYQMTKKMRTLEASERMMQAFLRNINNELRIPIKVFHKLANTIGKDDLYLSKSEKRNISEQLVYNSNLITTFLDEVMLFTGAEGKGHKLWLESFSPNALCRRCLEANMQSIYHRQSVRLTFKRELSDEFFVKSDRRLVELIVSKLIINACRFTEKGEITVGCTTDERHDTLTIYVKDTGRGIPENRLNNLFTFFEAPSHLQDEAELDLSICQRLASSLAGELIHDGDYLKGTRMLLNLPLR